MNYLKFLLSIVTILAILSCSKFPFGNKDGEKDSNKDKVKEEELKKREEDVEAKEDAIKNQQMEQLQQDKENLRKREEELDQRIRELTVESRIKAKGSPNDVTLALIQNIDNYVMKGNDAALMRAYNLWYNPLKSIGSYDKFKIGFSNTLNDKVLNNETISNDGFNAEVIITHFAMELNPKSTGPYDVYQKTKYEAKYKLVSDDGDWKIRSGKVTILSRDYLDSY